MSSDDKIKIAERLRKYRKGELGKENKIWKFEE